MRRIIFLFLSFAVAFSFTAMGQDNSVVKETKIKTFFHCPNGKALIEKELAKAPGVSLVVADLETKVVTVTYRPSETDQTQIVAAIEKIGYRTEFTPEEKQINKACSHDSPGGGEHH